MGKHDTNSFEQEMQIYICHKI